ncbi:MAG: hypothetical protein HYZ28_22865 [Myxococcales bacterium]|nr:hypothetical protein [Myxococcales bacterium]
MSLRVASVLLFASAASAEEAPSSREELGAAFAPAAMRAGSSSLYGFLGGPEVGGAYRQGIGPLEFEGRASFDYLALAFAGEAIGKLTVYREGIAEIAPSLGLGLTYDTGSRYVDPENFQYLGLRLRAGLLSTIRVAETARVLVALDVPWDLPLSPALGARFRSLLGGGAEFFLGQEMTGAVLAQLGAEVIKEPLGEPKVRPAWQIKLGLGWRLF